jgi:uncharacterized DUF497 family protein
MERVFEWDTSKAESNVRKHGIRFTQAAHVFNDPFAQYTQDRIEGGEERWQTLGMSGCQLLMVAHTLHFTDDAEIIRIISARPATKQERKRYESG